MPPISLKLRLLLWLYSTQNLLGCTLALGGLGLYFTGVIADWWLPIVAGLYGAGWLIVPPSKTLEYQVRSEATQANLLEDLQALLDHARERLPGEAVERLRRIQGVVEEVAPKLFSGEVAMVHTIALVNAVSRDLPETVANYLRLPPAFATLHTVADGRSCKQLLLDQLDFLGEQLHRIADSIYRADAEALVVNGKFLQEKFHSVSFVATE